MRIDSSNIKVQEPLPVGEGKSVCGHCHHLRHLKPSTESMSTTVLVKIVRRPKILQNQN